MTARASRRELRSLASQGHRGKTEAYRYIHRNLARFVAIGQGTERGPSWVAFADHLARAGLKNKNGGPLSDDSARKLFERVVRDEARARERPKDESLPPRTSYPRDLPASARPGVAATSPALQDPSPLGSRNAETAEPSDAGGFRLTLDPDGTLGGRPVTRGPLLPEPDYTGMSRSERIIARNLWHIRKRQIG